MAKPRRERALPVGVLIGLPMLGAIGLVIALRGVFPPGGIDARILDPAAIAGVCWAGQLLYVGHTLDWDRTVSRLWRHVFSLANALTVFRGALYAVVAGFVVVPPTTDLVWVPALAYGTGALLDKLDGTVARTFGRETALGERLDMAFDTFGFVVAPLVAVLWGLLPAWYLSLSAARYVYRGGLAWRRRRGRPIFDAPDSDLGKYLAGVQMAFITAALTPAVPTGLVRTLAPFVLAPSLAVFARDFLVVTGRFPGREN
ncbi:MAG: CDP-diacylglycerol--glycerol-3-phosphate 3-phosphatidyltransferase [Halobacteriales archaeon]|jgi:CDP-diacylglycerol--glycerol-3-phosphate 3-phosphatidyltransferase